MGASTKIQDTNLNLVKFICSQCQQAFTNQDKETDNWDVWWDTSGEPQITPSPYKGFDLTIWVRDLTHKLHSGTVAGKPWFAYDCPEKEVQNA